MRLFALSLAMLLAPAAAIAAPEDTLDDVFQRLKEAQTNKDTANVKKLATQLHEMAGEVIESAMPTDPDEKQSWTARVENAKNADVFSEYALYATAVQSEPATLVDLVAALEAQNPKSKYLDDAYGPYLVAVAKGGGGSKVPGIAEKALVNFPENEDLLLYMLDTANNRKQPDRALTYANRLIAVMSKHTKPQTVAAGDWERKRSVGLSHAYWTAGVINAEKGQYVAADKNLRAALPLIKGNAAMLAPALFHLGMVNYQLGKMTNSKAKVLEAATFSEQCASLDSAYTDQARHNALVMKQEAGRMR